MGWFGNFLGKSSTAAASEIPKIVSELRQIDTEYKTKKEASAFTTTIEIVKHNLENRALPLSNLLLRRAEQVKSLVRSIRTSFINIMKDPFLNMGKGESLNLRQVTAYQNMFKGNSAALEEVLKEMKKEKTDVQGIYAVMEELDKKLHDVRNDSETALSRDKKTLALLNKIDKQFTKLSAYLS